MIELEDLEDLAASWLNSKRREISPKTTARRLTAVRSLGRFTGHAVLQNYSAPTPADPQPHPLPEGVSGITRMIDACNTDEHRVLITQCGLVGMRVTESRETRPCDYDYANQRVRIFGKGSRERIVPVGDAAWRVLLPILVMRMTTDPKSPLVGISDRTARQVITQVGERAGISRRVSSHDLRATYATEAYSKTKDIRAVQKLLGHAGTKQTEVYIEIRDDALRDAANILE